MIPKPHSVLIIEENPQTGSFLRSIFVRAGYSAHVSASSREAIDHLMIDPDAISLMILDLRIRDMDMPLQSVLNSRRPDMKFIYLTDSQSPQELEQLTSANLWPIFAKTFAPGELLRVVQWLLEGDNATGLPSELEVSTDDHTANVDALLGV